MRVIPYGRQDIDEADLAAVMETLRSDWLTQGPAVERFEQALAERLGAAGAVAVNSATSALHLACRVLDLGPGDALWTSPNTFVASANCARYCGAEVDFVDIDPDTFNMSPRALEAKLEAASAAGRLPKVVVPVHFAGQACDMAAIRGLADRYGFRVVEDASHALGASYRDTPVGSGAYADMAVFSFHPVKIATTGEGGMVVTNRPEWADRLRRLRSHGITRDAAAMGEAWEGPWSYQQVELGYNYRLPDILASLGLSQLARLDAFIERRNGLAERYDRALANLPLLLPGRSPEARSAWHLYVVRVQPEAGKSRREVFEALRAAGIGVNVHYIPVHTQPYYQELGFRRGDFPASEHYYAQAISLPLYYGLTEADQDRVVAAVKEALA